ncbi:MAG: hypothetical protein ABSA16_09455 [Thermoguttaceae bacterium]|jgi:hypothetical protein
MLFAQGTENTFSVWSVVVGGILTIIGVIVGQSFSFISSRIKHKHRRASFLLQKLEDLTAAILDIFHWESTFRECSSIEQLASNNPASYSRRVVAIAQLYFPHLRDPAAKYSNAFIEYYKFGLDCARDDIVGNVGAQMVLKNPEAFQNHAEARKSILHQLDSAIEREAQIYINDL